MEKKQFQGWEVDEILVKCKQMIGNGDLKPKEIGNLLLQLKDFHLKEFNGGTVLTWLIETLHGSPLRPSAKDGKDETAHDELMNSAIKTIDNILEKVSLEDLLRFDKRNQTVLFKASSYGYTGIVKSIIKRAMALHDDSSIIEMKAKGGITPLSISVRRGHLETSQVLLEFVKDLESYKFHNDQSNTTLLHIAVNCNHETIVKLLVETLGDDICDIVSKSHGTPLDLAVKKNNPSMVKLLLQIHENEKISLHAFGLAACRKGRELALKTFFECSPRYLNLEWNSLNDETKREIEKYYLTAVNARRFETVKLMKDFFPCELIEHCVPTPCERQTALFIAIEQQDYEMTKLILDGSSPGFREIVNSGQSSPLHVACKGRNVEIVKLLLKQARPEYRSMENRWGNTALCLAARNENIQFLKVICNDNDDDEEEEEDAIQNEGYDDSNSYRIGYEEGVSALKFAVGASYIANVDYLLQKCPPECQFDRDESGVTLLFHACSWNKFKIAERLLIGSPKAYISEKTEDGNTALHCAADCNHNETLDLLLSHKHCTSDVKSIKDDDGKTALDMWTGPPKYPNTSVEIDCPLQIFKKFINNVGWIPLTYPSSVHVKPLLPMVIEIWKENAVRMMSVLDKRPDLLWACDQIVLMDVLPWIDVESTGYFEQ
eukprot:TRINITY_DN5703_c0_g1_i1.p1 TRINITY_DN5703_c0_g1~~TRINITY_DN5703_c0_g1_i1.p1  ORF type:complete len:661 (-),score=168.79 TRINITY_DN5703_c0_g1_i1:140-2122(-)